MVADAVAPWAETVLFTIDDLLALPDDVWRYELVEGRLVRMPPPGTGHGKMMMRLGGLVDAFVREHRLGTITGGDSGFILSSPGEPDTVLGPDVAFISASTMSPDEVGEVTGYLRIAPQLAVEIASPSQHRPELAAKAQRWLRAGTQVVWVVWPARRQVDVWDASNASEPRTLRVGDQLDGGGVLPGFSVQVADLWS